MNARPKAKPFTPNVEGYLFFSPNTKGLSGNPVKIRADLFVDFFCNVDPETHDGQTIIRDIESLKIFGKTAGPSARVSVPAKNETKAHQSRLNQINKNLSILTVSQSTASEKTFTTKNVRVFYHVLQKEGDAFPTIYISDIRVIRSGTDEQGGLYDYVKSLYSRKLAKSKNTNLDKKTVYISAACDSTEEAMKTAIANCNDAQPLLFFNPSSIAEDIGVWSKPRISNSTKNTIRELSELLLENQKRSVDWRVEGEGAAILARALANIPGTLEKHSFKFINPRTNLATLLQNLGQRKAQLHGEFLDYTRDQIALISIAQNSNAISDQLKNLPVQTGYDRIAHRYLTDYFHALGENGNAKAILAKTLSIKGSTGTFIDAITLSRRSLK